MEVEKSPRELHPKLAGACEQAGATQGAHHSMTQAAWHTAEGTRCLARENGQRAIFMGNSSVGNNRPLESEGCLKL